MTGEAAGVAAALSAKDNIKPSELNVKTLQQILNNNRKDSK